MPNNSIPPLRRRMLIPPATLATLRAQLDAFGLPTPGNVPPLTPARFQAELDLLAPLQYPVPARQPALHNLPKCSTPATGAKRTHSPPPLATTPNPTNVPQSSTPPPRDPSCAKRTQSPPPTLNDVPPSPDLTPRQERAARLLAAGHTAVSAAALLGVERHTIHRYKRLPAFNDHVRHLLAAL
jgi:hypothetical protein